jgi:hypothetical protein
MKKNQRSIQIEEKKMSEMSVGFKFDGELEKAMITAWLTVGDGWR